jgi:hypothetical protein
MLTLQKPGNSSSWVPVCSTILPANTPRTGDAGRTYQQSLWGCPVASSPHRRAWEWGKPGFRASTLPGIGTHLLRADQASGEGKQEWNDSRRGGCFPLLSPVAICLPGMSSLSPCSLPHQKILGPT